MLTRNTMSAVARDSLMLAPSYVVPGLASLISVPVLFALLGAAGYGRWALLFAIANGVPQVTTSWLESVVLRFGHRPDATIGRSLYLAGPAASMIVGLVLAIVFVPTASLLDVLAAALLTGAVGAYLVVVARLQSLLRFGRASRVAIVRAVTGAILSIAAAAILRDAAPAALGLAVGFAIGSIDGTAAIRRRDPSPSEPDDPAGDAQARRPAVEPVSADLNLRAYGVGSVIFAVGSFVLAVGDRFILSMLRPLGEVGVYAATYAIADLVFRFGPSVLVATVRQRLFRAWDAGDGRASPAIVPALLVLAWVMAASVVALVAIGPRIAVLPINAVLIGPIAAGLATFIVANALVVIYSGQIRQLRVAVHVSLAALLNVVLNLALVPSMGALGSALATVICYAAFLGLNLAGLRTSLGRMDRSTYPTVGALIITAGLATAWSGPGSWAVATGLSALALLAALPFLARLVRPWIAEA